MAIATWRRKLFMIPLVIALLFTFLLVSAAFAAGPGNHHCKGNHFLPAVAQERAGSVDHLLVVDRVQHAMDRIQRNVNRQVIRLGEVMGRVPGQAKESIQSAVQRLQDRLQVVLATFGETKQAKGHLDQGTRA
jgi:hypothetical protein